MINWIVVVSAFVGGFILGKFFPSVKKTQVGKTVVGNNNSVDNKNLYVGNLAYSLTEKELKETFEVFGKVVSVTIIKNRVGGALKRFGFVEMDNIADAKMALSALNNRDLKGRSLKVSFSHAKAEKKDPSRRTSYQRRSNNYKGRTQRRSVE